MEAVEQVTRLLETRLRRVVDWCPVTLQEPSGGPLSTGLDEEQSVQTWPWQDVLMQVGVIWVFFEDRGLVFRPPGAVPRVTSLVEMSLKVHVPRDGWEHALAAAVGRARSLWVDFATRLDGTEIDLSVPSRPTEDTTQPFSNESFGVQTLIVPVHWTATLLPEGG